MPRILIVDDSPTTRELIIRILKADPRIDVVGTAENGFAALKAVADLKPDLVTMDINMPVMDGIEAAARIMESTPVPIVMLSANYDLDAVYTAFQAVDAGALVAVSKPSEPGSPEFEEEAANLVRTVRLMAEIPVSQRIPRPVAKPAGAGDPVAHRAASALAKRFGERNGSVVAIGAGEGGPSALREILQNLPLNLPVPILVVQHMTPGFTTGYASWLAEKTGHPVSVVQGGEFAAPGEVFLAPEDHHLVLNEDDSLELSDAPSSFECRPAAGMLFDSVRETHPRNAIGIMLSGAGSDGARELRSMKDSGAMTFAQDVISSLVPDMPSEAASCGAAVSVLPPRLIARSVAQCLGMAPMQTPPAPPEPDRVLAN